MKTYKTLLIGILVLPDDYNDFKELFGLYSDIHPIISIKRFLTEVEITSVTEKCARFTEIFLIYCSQENVTRKIHEISFLQNKTVGFLSEEEGES